MLESKRRAIIFITISLVLALVAGFMFLQKVKDLNAQLGGMTKVYVAKENISSRAIIKPDQVETIELPNKFVTGSHIVDPEDITNRVSLVPLSEGDMITKNMLKPVSNIANENNRLVSLVGSEKVSFDQKLADLDRVDIVVSSQFEGKPVTEIFMSDVVVAGTLSNKGKFVGAALEVSKEAAPKLIHMQNYADSIRVLKANVGKEQPVEKEEAAEEAKKAEAEKQKAAEEAAKKKPAEQKPAEQKPAEKKPAEQKPAEKPAG
ncbi:Flp pilus assembly protein CpaB [Bacillus infantis]|uniref:Flp pilus assembly protein CpaB n=1 Tax=Bacillus infantis TaxID=324767 RepID=UPI003CE9C0E8